MNVQDEMALLRSLATVCRKRSRELEQWRTRRDKLALHLVEQGETWRAVADAAGFANPYIAELKKLKAKA